MAHGHPLRMGYMHTLDAASGLPATRAANPLLNATCRNPATAFGRDGWRGAALQRLSPSMSPGFVPRSRGGRSLLLYFRATGVASQRGCIAGFLGRTKARATTAKRVARSPGKRSAPGAFFFDARMTPWT